MNLIKTKDSKYSETDFTLAFQYALALIQSNYTSDWPKGRKIMQEIYLESSDPNAKRDYLFYCSVAELKMKNYKEAEKFAKSILYVEPFNHQAKALIAFIEKKQNKDMMIGAGALFFGGAALFGTILVASFAKK